MFMNLFFIAFDVFFDFHHIVNPRTFQFYDFSVLELISCSIELGNVIYGCQRVCLINVLTWKGLILPFLSFDCFVYLSNTDSHDLAMFLYYSRLLYHRRMLI